VTIFSHYNESKQRNEICKPSFEDDKPNYIFVGIKYDTNSVLVLFILIGSAWLLFSVIGILEITVHKCFAEQPYIIVKVISLDKIGLLVATVLFVGGIGVLSIDKFKKYNFCLMNPNDNECSFKDIDCFRNSTMPIQAVDFGFGKFVKTKKIFVETKCAIRPLEYFYVSEFNTGPSGIGPNNFILNGSANLNITNYSPVDDDTFSWYRRNDSSIRTKRKYSKSTNDLIINTDAANFELLFLDKNLPVSPNMDEIVSVLIVPWYQNTRTQLLNIKSMGKYYFKYFE